MIVMKVLTADVEGLEGRLLRWRPKAERGGARPPV
jgi:hypothetical protein